MLLFLQNALYWNIVDVSCCRLFTFNISKYRGTILTFMLQIEVHCGESYERNLWRFNF